MKQSNNEIEYVEHMESITHALLNCLPLVFQWVFFLKKKKMRKNIDFIFTQSYPCTHAYTIYSTHQKRKLLLKTTIFDLTRPDDDECSNKDKHK